MNMEQWLKLGDSSIKREDFTDCPNYKSLDLSSKTDITSSMDLFTKEIDGVKHYYFTGRFYLPEDTAQEEGKDHYQEWLNTGDLIATDGNIIDYQRIEDDIVSDAGSLDIQNIGYDPWGATQCAQRLQDEHGLPVLEIPQNVKHLSEPMKELEALVKAGRIHHDNNPVMNWMMSNVVAKEDANENIYPRKEVPENKIDGPVSAIMCMLLAMDESEGEGPSVYEERGIVAF